VFTCIYQYGLSRIEDGSQVGCNTVALKTDILFLLWLRLFNPAHPRFHVSTSGNLIILIMWQFYLENNHFYEHTSDTLSVN